MLRYNLLFLHVAAAMGTFMALGIEALALTQLRRASSGDAEREALAAVGSSRRVSGVSMLVLLLTGLALAGRYWQWQGAWIGAGLVGLVAIGTIDRLMSGRHLRWTSFAIRTALLAGVIYVMTVKPGRVVSLGVLGAAVVVGLVVSRALPRSGAPRATPAIG
jgi:hypothetical protein